MQDTETTTLAVSFISEEEKDTSKEDDTNADIGKEPEYEEELAIDVEVDEEGIEAKTDEEELEYEEELAVNVEDFEDATQSAEVSTESGATTVGPIVANADSTESEPMSTVQPQVQDDDTGDDEDNEEVTETSLEITTVRLVSVNTSEDEDDGLTTLVVT